VIPTRDDFHALPKSELLEWMSVLGLGVIDPEDETYLRKSIIRNLFITDEPILSDDVFMA
jgi:hypothetical protein